MPETHQTNKGEVQGEVQGEAQGEAKGDAKDQNNTLKRTLPIRLKRHQKRRQGKHVRITVCICTHMHRHPYITTYPELTLNHKLEQPLFYVFRTPTFRCLHATTNNYRSQLL